MGAARLPSGVARTTLARMYGFQDLAEQFLIRARPGWLLHRLARVPVPVLHVDAIASRSPGPATGQPAASPLVEPITPRPTPAGVLDGDVVIKDQIDVAGCRTGVGAEDGGEIAAQDAIIVARIVAAGGRVIGKAKMTELGIDGIGSVMHYAMPENPRAPGYAPGGSSTGTAVAVASGLARYGVGGDGLGSIRIPAAFCGLVGLKPSRDRLPRDGIRSPVRTLDAVGPIARTVADCARFWQVMAGEPIADVAAWLPERIGVPLGSLRPARAIGRAFDRALAALGVLVEQFELPGLASATFLGGMIGAHEMSTGPFADRPRTRAGRMSRALGGAISVDDAVHLYRQRDALRAATGRALERTPILALPTTAIPPPALTPALRRGGAELFLLRALGAYTPLANLTDLPSIAVPCGVDDRGRPLSIMFVAGRGREAELLGLAAAVEQTGLGTAPI
ncbi:MAG: amidase [Deltaproteobacteria bacterium]|nr:amidase [Deltaproteobacteria bacterium]